MFNKSSILVSPLRTPLFTFLIVYKNNPYNFSPYASVRSISENCVGTYNGVFIDTLKLKKTRYTDGQIREFDSVIFICYNGLTEFKNNEEIQSIWRHFGARLGDQKAKEYIVYFHILSHKINFLETFTLKRDHN